MTAEPGPKRFRTAEEGNRRHWNELAAVHARSYHVRELLEGRCQLDGRLPLSFSLLASL
ncbi:MAG: hypothetical protein R6U36_01055 [Candidatus Fermentibacteraceae bacterium]